MKSKIKILNRFLYILLILWMIVIFYFSHQPVDKSSEIRGGISKPIVEWFDSIIKINI